MLENFHALFGNRENMKFKENVCNFREQLCRQFKLTPRKKWVKEVSHFSMYLSNNYNLNFGK